MTEIKKGAFRKQLGIPVGKKVPKTFVKSITKAEVGDVVSNPTSVGKPFVTVTEKMKKRAYFVESFM